ncbi:PfaD family polyunsaturated fatty acid/polyketide biosynthesis protein [Streptomyces sp. NPDC051677]|uniref:PfaD family polyunsaturated fatty acid/polyketide biosynthesis protein n=1 Tax=Streptomyces sp. NPDC051677 TaxID=3365669 RepID=UPI0037D61F18
MSTVSADDPTCSRDRHSAEESVTGRPFAPESVARLARTPRIPVTLLRGRTDGRRGALPSADVVQGLAAGLDVIGELPGTYPEWLGDQRFTSAHGVRYPYVAGEMANGISTTAMVRDLARSHMLGFFGAAGLPLERIEAATADLAGALTHDQPWGVNLIHTPGEPALEERTADLLLARNVRRISASAFMELTPAVVRCSAAGLRTDRAGHVVRRTHLFAKVSRPETAAAFMSPAPPALLTALVERGQLSHEEAALAARVPVAQDITVEGDSGGHTDNRPLISLLPRVLALRERIQQRCDHPEAVRVGAAGGLGTPQSVAAAFALGAAYVVTGSVNQTAREAGISDEAKRMLAAADLTDVIMAPAADMFELGVKVQVLRRGSMFGVRALKLYDLYRTYDSLEALPAAERAVLERDILRAGVAEIWAETARFWGDREPGQLQRAATDPKHRMALLFRWYLGRSSGWAVTGDTGRSIDYQLWCGPALGAFNHWAAESFLADPAQRTVVQIARNLLEGATVLTRAHQLRGLGLPVPDSAFSFAPRPLA